MVELYSWLSHQHRGLKTYVTLQQKADELARTDAEHRAVYKLLSSMLDPFIASFDEEPLPVSVAESTYLRQARRRADRCVEQDCGGPVGLTGRGAVRRVSVGIALHRILGLPRSSKIM